MIFSQLLSKNQTPKNPIDSPSKRIDSSGVVIEEEDDDQSNKVAQLNELM
jgi:hypothetical protein